MNKTIEILKSRRSIRAYKKEEVSEKELNQILEAGMYAPSGQGLQSALMVVVQKKEIIGKLSKMNAKFTADPDSDPFYGASTVVIVLADSTKNNYIQDGSLVMGNLMNAAHALDVDSCWINRAKEVFESPEGLSLLTEWGIDTKYVGIGNCILGYRDCEYPKAKPRKENYIIRVK